MCFSSIGLLTPLNVLASPQFPRRVSSNWPFPPPPTHPPTPPPRYPTGLLVAKLLSSWLLSYLALACVHGGDSERENWG